MDLQEIHDKLNTLLQGTERKIVFWYDDDAAYAEDISRIKPDAGNQLWILTEDNWFEIKLTLEERYPQINYVVFRTANTLKK